VARRLGWRPEFRWERLAQWAARHGGVRVLERRPMPPLGHFSLIRFERSASGANGQGRRLARLARDLRSGVEAPATGLPASVWPDDVLMAHAHGPCSRTDALP
jgi:hypothetical protein